MFGTSHVFPVCRMSCRLDNQTSSNIPFDSLSVLRDLMINLYSHSVICIAARNVTLMNLVKILEALTMIPLLAASWQNGICWLQNKYSQFKI